MTSLNVIVQPGIVYLLADAAATDETGKVVSLQSKIIQLPDLSIAFAFTGQVPAPRLLTRGIEAAQMIRDQAAGDQERALAAMPTMLAELHRQNVDEIGLDRPHSLSCVIAAWRHRDGEPQAWIAQSDDLGMPNGYRPYTPMRVRQYLSLAHADEAVADCTDPMAFNPYVDGAELLERHRRSACSVDQQGVHNVGGRVELAAIGFHGVSLSIIQRWPDRIGRLIKPNSRGSLWRRLAAA